MSIKVAVFKGKDKTTFLKRQEFGFQCLVVAMKNVINYIDSINETYIDTSVRPRKEKRMFSQDAFIEAWINAVVHNLSEASDKLCYEKKKIMRRGTEKVPFFLVY